MKKIKLDFMIVPSELIRKCYVPDRVRIRITDPKAIFLEGILGESGRKMVKSGCEFYFTRKLATRFIKWGIAVKIREGK